MATGERLATRAEFPLLLRTGAAQILQPALGRAGGIWEPRKLAAMAESVNAQIAPRLNAGSVECAANNHLAAPIPNLLMAETIETPFHDRLVRGALRVEVIYITAPQSQRPGIEVDEDLARSHTYEGTGLHLEMSEAPCDYVNGNLFEGGAPAQRD